MPSCLGQTSRTQFLGNQLGIANQGGGAAVLGPMGIVGSLFHKGASKNIWRHVVEATPYCALDTATLRPELGGSWGSDTTFRVKPIGDLLSYTALIVGMPAICAEVDSEVASTGRYGYPVMTNVNFPLLEEDNVAYTAAGSQQEWLQENYGACASIDVTSTVTCSATTAPFVSYTVNVAVYTFKTVNLMMGNNIIDTKTAQYIIAEDELAGSTDFNYTEMWGGASNFVDAILAAAVCRTCYVIPPFTHCKSLGSAIALVAAMFSKTEYTCQIEDRENLIVRSAQNVLVMNAETGQQLQDSDVELALDIRVVLLEELYREAFASSAFEQVIMRTLPLYQQKAGGNSISNHSLNAQGYIVAFVLMVQRMVARDKNLLNYYAGIAGLDAITGISLTVNNTTYFTVEAQRARMLYPAQAANRIPRLPCYLLYFSPIVFTLQVISGKNFSMVAEAHISLEWQEGLQNEECIVYIFQLQMTFIKYRMNHANLLLR